MNRILHIFCGLFVLLLLSCGNKKLQKQLEEFIQSEVVVPYDMRQLVEGRGLVATNNIAGSIQLVIWADSVACSSCRLNNIFEYDEIIHFREEAGEKYVPIFLFSPSHAKINDVTQTLDKIRFDYPIVIDERQAFPAANPHIPADSRFHTFLLDRNGKVILVGDPVNNPQLWELYKSTIIFLYQNGKPVWW